MTYRAVLAAMPPEGRLSVHGRLITEVLGGFVEGSFTLSGASPTASSAASVAAASGGESPPSSLSPNAANASSTTTSLIQNYIYPIGTPECLLSDVFEILACPEMRSATSGGSGGGSSIHAATAAAAGMEDMDEELVAAAEGKGPSSAATEGAGGEGVVSALAAAAKGRLLHRLVQKHVSENVIPICLSAADTK